MTQKYKVESFNLDHTKVTAPFVRLASKKVGPAGDIVTKFDIRVTQPNKEFMPTDSIHTIEHLAAEYLRDEIPSIIDFSPMGCRTGFYLTVFGDFSEKEIASKMLNVMKKIADWPADKVIPGQAVVECGNYLDHNLAGAKEIAKKWAEKISVEGFNCFR
ncbi:MAG: S-ribosylhomocysteine lyase [Elusimicrobiota bacterium]|jgi:S-ribosylhomocysteine lyase|nr:S-ribosylhomocysteine lyase [Elusimicrobiota bacterium]